MISWPRDFFLLNISILLERIPAVPLMFSHFEEKCKRQLIFCQKPDDGDEHGICTTKPCGKRDPEVQILHPFQVTFYRKSMRSTASIRSDRPLISQPRCDILTRLEWGSPVFLFLPPYINMSHSCVDPVIYTDTFVYGHYVRTLS